MRLARKGRPATTSCAGCKQQVLSRVKVVRALLTKRPIRGNSSKANALVRSREIVRHLDTPRAKLSISSAKDL